MPSSSGKPASPASLASLALRPLYTAEQIRERVSALGLQITRDYAGGDLVLVGVLKGSFLFLADLCRAIDLPMAIDFLGLQSYGDETTSSGVVQITSDLTRPIEGKDVLVVEDIVDTGLTMEYLLENLRLRHPRSVKVCSLLHKPERSVRAVTIDYVGFVIPNAFVVGYGLDYAQKYRNLPYIGVVESTG
jgi:hypoxanthine phosphoribosyltransferase